MRGLAAGGSYCREYVDALRRPNAMNIQRIYSGHDQPVLKEAQEMLKRSLELVLESEIG